VRVLIISPCFFPIVGGTEVAIYEISKRLIKKGYEVIILTPNLPGLGRSKQFEEIEFIEVYRFPTSSYMYKFFYSNPRLLGR